MICSFSTEINNLQAHQAKYMLNSTMIMSQLTEYFQIYYSTSNEKM